MAEHDLQSIAFPTLDEAQMTRLSGCTAALARSFQDGQTLFAVGDRDMKFFVVKSGEVAIIDLSGDEPKQLTVHRKGQFTGEISHLTGAPAEVSAVARGPCEVIEISRDALRRLLNQCPDMSDIIQPQGEPLWPGIPVRTSRKSGRFRPTRRAAKSALRWATTGCISGSA